MNMISADSIGKGAEGYLWRKEKERYYFGGGEPKPIWLCTGAAKHFKLSGQVDRKVLRSLLRGFDPNGNKLVRNAGKCDGKRRRHMGMSYVFNADKNWSIIWAMAPPGLRDAMEAAFQRAVERTFREYIEKEVARCRLRDGTEVAGTIIGAMFIHGVSREGDPHYHGHVLIPSEVLCPDGHTRAAVSKHFFEQKLPAGAYFRVALEQESRPLGLEFSRPLDRNNEPKSYSVVAGIPLDVRRHFSKRRTKIEQRLDSQGLSSAAAAAVATLQTRDGKEAVTSGAELFTRCAREAASLDFSLDSVIRQDPGKQIDHAKEYYPGM
jgi:conjugative relaxase-like TrwC/TraI family protein